MRIYSEKFYITVKTPGLSGFQRWNEKEERIITGKKARVERPYVDREYIPNGEGRFRIFDGHLPDRCPIDCEKIALEWLKANPFQEIEKIAVEEMMCGYGGSKNG